MSIETFTWRVQGQPEGNPNQRVRSAQFGDGYKQVSGDGINPETQTWPLSFSGHKTDMQQLLAFVRRHTTKSFIWTPPLGEKGLYRVVADSIRTVPIGGMAYSISVTFEQAYAP